MKPTTTAKARSNSAVYFEGGADNFVFYPGSEWNETDLFDGFKSAMPGDKLTETVATMSDFLAQLTMRVYNGGELVYNATPDQTDGLSSKYQKRLAMNICIVAGK